jgi:hypothetical protein
LQRTKEFVFLSRIKSSRNPDYINKPEAEFYVTKFPFLYIDLSHVINRYDMEDASHKIADTAMWVELADLSRWKTSGWSETRFSVDVLLKSGVPENEKSFLQFTLNQKRFLNSLARRMQEVHPPFEFKRIFDRNSETFQNGIKDAFTPKIY